MIILLKIFMGLYLGGSVNPLMLDQALSFASQWFPLVLLLLAALFTGLWLCRPRACDLRMGKDNRRV